MSSMLTVKIDELINFLQSNDLENEETQPKLTKIKDRSQISIRSIQPSEYESADQILQRAFYQQSRDRARFEIMHISAKQYAKEIYVAEYDHRLIGVAMACHWGSIRVIGPIGVLPQYQQNGIGKMLIGHLHHSLSVVDKHQKIKRDVLFTSVKTHHVGFYMKIGMLPKYLTYITRFDIEAKYKSVQLLSEDRFQCIRKHDNDYRFQAELQCSRSHLFISQCQSLTNQIFDGLDLSTEIEGYHKHQGIGSCVGLFDAKDTERLSAFAICSFGQLSEAPNHVFKIRFAAANGYTAFCILLCHIIEYARTKKYRVVEAGMNVGRVQAFRTLTELFEFEYDAKEQCIDMGKSVDSAEVYTDYNTSDSYIVGDWRG